jgi:hypothetical protein
MKSSKKIILVVLKLDFEKAYNRLVIPFFMMAYDFVRKGFRSGFIHRVCVANFWGPNGYLNK